MSYNPLSDSGGTPDERRAEAWRIIEIFRDCNALGQLDKKEREFMDKMAQGFAVTPGQLFWMRDLKTKYCE